MAKTAIRRSVLAVRAALEHLQQAAASPVPRPATTASSAAPAAGICPARTRVDQLTDRIVALVAARPGIRTAEIADELDLAADLVRQLLQPRLANSQVIADRVPDLAGRLLNAYRINPKWTPADADLVRGAAPARAGERN